jgi:hypothetical protein
MRERWQLCYVGTNPSRGYHRGYHKEHASEFLDRQTPLRRYNVSAALKIETGGGLAS